MNGCCKGLVGFYEKSVFWYDLGIPVWMERAWIQRSQAVIRGFFSVYIQVLRWNSSPRGYILVLMNSSDYCIQANPPLACVFVLCSDLRPVFSRTRWNTVSSQVDTIVGNTDDLQVINTETGLWFYEQTLNFWTRCDVSVILCLSSPMWSMKQTFLDTVLISIITLCPEMLLLAQDQLQPVCSSICHCSALEICGPSSSLASKTLARIGLNDLAFLAVFFTPAFTLLFSGLINCAEKPVI